MSDDTEDAIWKATSVLVLVALALLCVLVAVYMTLIVVFAAVKLLGGGA